MLYHEPDTQHTSIGLRPVPDEDLSVRYAPMKSYDMLFKTDLSL